MTARTDESEKRRRRLVEDTGVIVGARRGQEPLWSTGVFVHVQQRSGCGVDKKLHFAVTTTQPPYWHLHEASSSSSSIQQHPAVGLGKPRFGGSLAREVSKPSQSPLYGTVPQNHCSVVPHTEEEGPALLHPVLRPCWLEGRQRMTPAADACLLPKDYEQDLPSSATLHCFERSVAPIAS